MNKFIKSATNTSNWLKTDKEICFIGRSNVGKSSLLNAIFNEKIAHTSKIPGHTKLINFFSKNNNIFVDLPGYGYAKISKANKNIMDSMVKQYFDYRDQLIMTFVLIDSKIGITKIDEQVINYLKFINRDFFILCTKKEKANQSELYKTKLQIQKYTNNFLLVSAHKKINIDKLNLFIEECFNKQQ